MITLPAWQWDVEPTLLDISTRQEDAADALEFVHEHAENCEFEA